MQRAAQRAAAITQALSSAWRLEQTRGAKAVTTKLAVELLKDVEGVGAKDALVWVNHGYARNCLVPNGAARVLPRPKRVGQQAAAAAAAGGAQPAARSSSPADLTLEKQQQQFDKLLRTLATSTLTLKRRTVDGQALEQAVTAQDVADALARQLRIRLAPEMLDLGGQALPVVGEYRLPLKLVLASGDRAHLDVTVTST